MPGKDKTEQPPTYLPFGWERLLISEAVPVRLWVHTRLRVAALTVLKWARCRKR